MSGRLVLFCAVVCCLANAEVAAMSTEDAFEAGKQFGSAAGKEASGSLTEGRAAQALPQFGRQASESGFFQQGGRAAIEQFGSAKIGSCANSRAPTAFEQQECDAVNFLSKNRDKRQRFTITAEDPLLKHSDGVIANPGATAGQESQCHVVDATALPTYVENTCTQSRAIEHRTCRRTANVSVTHEDVLSDSPYRHHVNNRKAPAWQIEVRPAQGVAVVTGSFIEVGERDGTCEEGPGGDAGFSYYPCRIKVYGVKSEEISIYGGQTRMEQGYRCYGLPERPKTCAEWFVIRAQQVDACTFRFDNLHIRGGGGYPDVHDYSQFNFCVPKHHVHVNWQDDCAGAPQ